MEMSIPKRKNLIRYSLDKAEESDSFDNEKKYTYDELIKIFWQETED